MDLKLSDKRVLITGSTAGIGLAIAEGFIKEGAHVILNGRSQERIDRAIADLLSRYPDAQVSGVPADFSNVDQINRLIKDVGGVDILVNNVGIFEPRAFGDIKDEDWYRLFEINVMSGIRLTRALMPEMMRQDWGRIVFISSESGVQIPDEMIHYGMTKTAQIAVAGGLARLTKGTQVTVNTVLPGPTRSEGAGNFVLDLAKSKGVTEEAVEKDFFENVRATSLIQRFADTSEVANMVVYLCSPLASATNGAALRVDGGTIPTIL